MLCIYKTIVRPLVEHCIIARAPEYIKDKLKIERIQRRFTQMIPAFKGMDYETRLKKLGLYKMFHGIAAPEFDIFFMVRQWVTMPS